MSKPSSVRSSSRSRPVSSTCPDSTVPSKGRYLRPVPYATTLALAQFFDGGSMEEHIARRTTPSAKPSPLSPHHHQSRRQSRQKSSSSTRSTQQQQQSWHSSDRQASKHPERGHHTSSRWPAREPTPVVVSGAERDIGKGAGLPVVDEKGRVWYDWEEKQEFAPLITGEHERSGWVNFPGGATRRNSSSSSGSSGSGSDGGEGRRDAKPVSASAFPLPLHAVLDAFTFQPQPLGGGGGAVAPAAAAAAAVATTAAGGPKDPLALAAPPRERPRGKDRRIVRPAGTDSLPSLVLVDVDQAERDADADAAAREFLDASFDPARAMLAMQQSHAIATATTGTAATAATAADALLAPNNKIKRASMSMKGLKKLIFRKKSTSA